ncbi:MAG: efflux RND transporter periplasmic adaptor subunit [Candidatus Thiodiazotropha sp. (ex Dulcina madagascariensis)]|nr:efflux RND transporter periplasmic adaptor subunit [Candidatus Thiodiazotropha sp. (ex Epidulcina cf. delphinae)]MCU7923317.1 efflux RND transporter periplasmic adaptor subunit [Candidatus Thiodiazotropha sp. (ex Dulcina madagascariensis)]MCU7928088.1 efflux RND transporter periplasmic adaptor subunit [Candidatus Thiodiazotropha sp. (ex Dulcina madagascariensis)]
MLNKHPHWRKLLILPPVALGILVLMLMAGNKQSPVKAERGEPTKLVRIIETPQLELIPVAEGYGSIQPARVWSAVAEVSGRIVELHPRLRDGEIISQGSLLLRIDPADYALNLAQAEAELAELEVEQANAEASLSIEQRSQKIAQREFERITKLAAKGTASQSDVDDAERNLLNSRNAVQNVTNSLALIPTKRKVLEAKQTQAGRDLQNTSVYAPFNLRVANMGIEVDQFVGKGEMLLEGDAVDRVEVIARFPMSSLRRLFIGREKTAITADILEGNLAQFVAFQPRVRLDMGTTIAEWEAEFVRFSDNVDPETRTMGVVVAVDKPFEKVIPGLRPPLSKGMFVQVNLQGKPQPERIVLPRSAIRDGVVYLADEQNRLRRQPVEILFSQGEISIVAKGVEAGQKVVVSDLVPAVSGMLLQTIPDEAMAQAIKNAARGKL